MSDLIKSFTAFRVFGVFDWPPVPGSLGVDGSHEGVVEIHYIDDPKKHMLSAVLRWVPRDEALKRFELGSDELDSIEYLHHLDAQSLAEKFAVAKKIELVRLDSDSLQSVDMPDERLLFRGASVFDQFAMTSDENFGGERDPIPDLRWVLARNYDHGSASQFSEVIIGQTSDKPKTNGSTIRFNLALPTPIAQCVIDAIRVQALPFSVTYPATVAKDLRAAPVPKTFMAGSSNFAVNDKDKEFNLAGKVIDARLGRFGFCRSNGGKDFVFFPRKNQQDKSKYWLDSKRAYREELLGRLGNVGNVANFEFGHDGKPSERGEFWDSVQFIVVPNSGTRMVFRSGIVPTLTGTDLGKDDLVVAYPRFQIKNPDRPDQWIVTDSARTGLVTSELKIELDLTYDLKSSDIWRVGIDPVGDPRITVRLGFNDSIRRDVGKGKLDSDAGSTTDETNVSVLFNDAIRGMRLARLDLQHLDDPQPQSILPDVELSGRNVRFALTASVSANFSAGGQLNWETRPADGWSGANFRLTLWPNCRFLKNEPYNELTATISPYSFVYEDVNKPGANRIPVRLTNDPAASKGLSDEFAQFRITPRDEIDAKLTGRLGGIEFATNTRNPLFAEETDEKQEYSYWRFGSREPIRDVADTTRVYRTARVDVRLRFAIVSVKPLGVDIPWADRTRRPRPLLVSPNEPNESNFILDLRETLSQGADRHLTARLIDQTNTPPSDSKTNYVVLGEEPFTITKFHSTALGNRGAQDNASVAFYDSDTRSWQLKLVASNYHYEFPPQVAGESMDKPRRLEIHDRKNLSTPPTGVVEPVFVIQNEDGTDSKVMGARAVEFRLTPSAEIWIEPSDIARGYFLPEWASYEIFRQRGAYGLGAALAAFRGEFLYGLTVGVDPDRETGVARGARVAEIEALTGRPSGKPYASNADETLTKRWEGLSRAIARRPERLEIWNRDFSGSTAFTPARFESGVSFALRNTAIHRPAVVNSNLPPPQNVMNGVLPRSRDFGLSGGALWPIESANLFNKLLQAPASNGGFIERIALSPSGGDADQKAEFLNGQVAIISETRNGFVQRHKVEVIGRIGVSWHRAKHVVVYERTVNSSAQFTLEPEIGTRTRRPVLRKVSEYIELLQPIRAYPDFPSAKPATSGLMNAVRFNSKIINVDSAWSEDVGDYGWKIPLWNRDSARRRPQVYPRPDIAVVTHAEGEGDQPLGTQECLDPDTIFFFADFEKGGNDTDSWQSRIGIDCSALPAPDHGSQPPLDDDEYSDGTNRQASVLRIPRGHRRFTWRLAPAARKTALNAGRAEAPLYASLESITFMRSSPAAAADAFGDRLEQARKQVNKLTAPTDRLPTWGPDNSDAAPVPLKDVGDALTAFRNAAATSGNDATVIQTARNLITALNTIPDKIKTGELKKYVESAETVALDQVESLLGTAPSRCEKLAGDLLGSLKRKELLIIENLAAWENFAYSMVPPAPQLELDIKGLKERLKDEAANAIRPAFSDVGMDRLGLGSSVEAARSIIRDLESDVLTVERAFDGKLAELHRIYDDGKPWSSNRIRSFLDKLNAERDGILRDSGSAIADARLRLATDLDDLSRRVGAIASEAIGAIASKISGLRQEISTVTVGIEGALANAIDEIDALLAQDTSGKDKFDAYDAKLAEIEGKAGVLGPRVAAVRVLLKSLQDPAKTTRTNLAGIKSTLAATTEDLEKKMAAMVAAVEAAAAAVGAFAGGFAAVIAEALAIAAAAAAGALAEVESDLKALADAISDATINQFVSVGSMVDRVIAATESWIHGTLETGLFDRIDAVLNLASDTGDALAAKVGELEKKLSADGLIADVLKPHLIAPVVEQLFGGIPDKLTPYEDVDRQRLVTLVSRFGETARAELRSLTGTAIATIKTSLVDACNSLGGELSNALERLKKLGDALIADAAKQVTELTNIINAADQLRKRAKSFGQDIRMISNDLAASYAAATSYAEKVFESVGNLGSSGLAAAPSNILKLYAAVASAPALPNLAFARERLGYYYKELNEIIDTTPVEAWFGRLGDELKALGLSLPFDKLSDRLLPDDLSSLDISRLFKNFGGMKFDSLFKGYKLPKNAKDAIKVTHAFDKKLFRAWVQIDVDVPIPGRRSLFSVGPFQLDFVDSRMVGQVRLEASKDSDKVEQSGRASVGTDIEAVVGGQTMVTLRKVAVRFERSSGLSIDFDPKNIKLNAIFQFVQDTLGSLFPDEAGGLKLIKENGIPVGVEHEFSMPPVDLMFGTSGVSNIQISNRFALVAYPDFVISDRFSLSKPELPFLFSIFIIGGTGYITVDTEYRPFGNGLMVVVEAAAGGSAALGFAFGPVSGSVFITLSVALSYRKLIGNSGGGLTVSLVLLVAGNVSVAGIVTVYIGLLLRMSYRDNGQIDATGTLSLTIKISIFFKITVRANVQYKLRGGQSQTTSSVSAGGEITDEKLTQARSKAEKLLKARGEP